MPGQPGESGQGPYSPFSPYTQQGSPPRGSRNISNSPPLAVGPAGESEHGPYSSFSPRTQQGSPSGPGAHGYRNISGSPPGMLGQAGESVQGPGFSDPRHSRGSSLPVGRHQEGYDGNDNAQSRSPTDDPFAHPKPPFDPNEVPTVPICMLMANCQTNSQLRKAISHVFGRNKMCTRQIPDNVWVHYCRKHYQRVRYRNVQKYAELQIDMVIKQVHRVQAWSQQNVALNKAGQLTAWQLMARKREQMRLENEAGRKGAGCKRTHSESIAGDHINGDAADGWLEPERKKGSTMPNAVPPWLQEKCGQMYQTDQVLDILREIERQIVAAELQQIPDIELLPQITTDPAEESRQKYKRRSQTTFHSHSRTPSFETTYPSDGGNGFRQHTGYLEEYCPSGVGNGPRPYTGYSEAYFPPGGGNRSRPHTGYSEACYPSAERPTYSGPWMGPSPTAGLAYRVGNPYAGAGSGYTPGTLRTTQWPDSRAESAPYAGAAAGYTPGTLRTTQWTDSRAESTPYAGAGSGYTPAALRTTEWTDSRAEPAPYAGAGSGYTPGTLRTTEWPDPKGEPAPYAAPGSGYTPGTLRATEWPDPKGEPAPYAAPGSGYTHGTRTAEWPDSKGEPAPYAGAGSGYTHGTLRTTEWPDSSEEEEPEESSYVYAVCHPSASLRRNRKP